MLLQYMVGGSIFGSRTEAIKAAVEWWGTACGTQPLDPSSWTEEEIRETLSGWCRIYAPSMDDEEIERLQQALDEEVIRFALAVMRDPGLLPVDE